MERKTEKIIVSYIKSPSELGESLFQQVKDVLKDFVLRKNTHLDTQYEIEIQDIVEKTLSNNRSSELANCQQSALYACLYSDIVIFDGSIEDGNYNQYQFAYDLMKHLDYVLIVSRTQLPYNFEGRRKGGAPSWIKIGESTVDSESEADPRELNKLILSWLNDTLNLLELPRSDKLAEPISFTNVLTITKHLMNKSDERMEPLEKASLFISYLSKDYELLKHSFSQIEQRTGVLRESFHFFAPGKVAKEFMTEQRRWEIVSITDREIHKNGSLLIFETEGYYQSWWTMGERMSVSYKYQDNWDNCPTVYIFKVYQNSEGNMEFDCKVLNTPKQKKKFFPDINVEQFRRLARRFANSDPHEAAYELDEKTIRSSEAPAIVKLPAAILKGAGVYLLEKTGALEEGFDEKSTLFENIVQAWESENSYTHTREFRTKRILECKYCRDSMPALTMDNFIQLDMPYVYRVEDKELVKMDDGHWIFLKGCPIHGSIQLKKNGHYYRFIQPRQGKLKGEKKTLIESIDRIEI